MKCVRCQCTANCGRIIQRFHETGDHISSSCFAGIMAANESLAAGFCITYQFELVGVPRSGYFGIYHRICHNRSSNCEGCQRESGEKLAERVELEIS